MNINEYLKHPAGKGAVIPGREMLLDRYNYRYQVLNKNKHIDMKVYVDGNNVYYHLIIPSESEFKENDYDIILKFSPRNQTDIDDKSYRQYEMQVFSNCPSFTYTYAYVAKLNGYLIPELMNKYDEQVLQYPPVSRNPGLLFSYEKSIYYACLYVTSEKQFLTKMYVETHGKKLTKNILNEIRHINQIQREVDREQRLKTERRKKMERDIFRQVNKLKPREEAIERQPKKSNVNVVKKTTAKKKGITPIKKKK